MNSHSAPGLAGDCVDTPIPHNRVPKVPAQVQPYVDALGVEMTLLLFEKFSGTSIYIPRRPSERNALAAVIGEENIAKLTTIGSSSHFEVPMVKRWRALCYHEKGLNGTQIARKLGVTRRMVHYYLKGADRPPPDPNQMSLF